ncbi:MAG TPA: trypsin-like serine protease [Polyangiaceae bacterium]|nr:trypsin-like serine protease [Polyangiaceae bacterium]
MDISIGLVAMVALVAGCSGQAVSALPKSAPSADIVAPPPGVDDRGDDPAVVAIDVDGAPPCAGALVAPDVVLAARHCVSLPVGPSACAADDGGPPPPLRAAGSLHILVGDDIGTAVLRARGRDILVPGAASMCGADIALILLDVPIDDVQPLVVRPTGAAQGDHLRTVGWRLPLEGGRAPKILRDHLLVAETSSTELELEESAGAGGGPAIDETTAEVLGVFSRSADDPSLAVYTRTDAFVGLVESALAASESVVAASRGLRKPKKGAADMGANCAAGAECAAGVCVSVSGGLGQYCSRGCGAYDKCPTHFRCQRSQSGSQVCTGS